MRRAGCFRVALALVVATGVAEARHGRKPVKAHAAKASRPSHAARPAPASATHRLGKGYALLLDGDFHAARAELAPLADEKKLLDRDYALYLLAQAESFDGARASARKHFAAVAAMQQSRLATVARARAADLAFLDGDRAAARAGYEAVVKADSPSVEPAVARLHLAEIALADGDKAGAARQLHAVWASYPEHPVAEQALAKWRALDAAAVLDARDHVARAKRLTNERLWQQALDELSLVPPDVAQAVRDEADYWIGETHFKMRHGYDIAAQKLLAVADRLDGDRKTEALFHGARAWSRADQDDKAIALYKELVAKYPHCKQAPEASFLVGWLDYNRGHYKEALPGFEETIRRYPNTNFARDARWYHGFSRWLLGDAAGALDDFEDVATHGGEYDGGKGRYWKAMALAKLGRKDEAIATWRELVGLWPLSYYPQLARVRLAEIGVHVGPFGDRAPPTDVAPPGRPDPALAHDPAFARIDELVEAGMTPEAGIEFDRADGPLLKQYGNKVLPNLFAEASKAENFFRMNRIAESHDGDAWRGDPATSPSVAAWWKLVYPLAYRRYIEKYAPTGHNPTYYLYTIMQKESAYNPYDVSYADAIGLLQMIPPTSRRVSDKIGRPYTDDVLYDPEGNIQFGAWYIGHLLEKFHGQIALGAGAFNAGPKAMMHWVEKSGDHPLDEFIELCAYTQTREYMKKVLDIYAHYLYLYEKQEYLPSMHVEKGWLDDGIDY